MTIRRLLWGMTWRGALGGAIAGAIFGAFYGVLTQLQISRSNSGIMSDVSMADLPLFVMLFGVPSVVVALGLGLNGGALLSILTMISRPRFTTGGQFARMASALSAIYGALAIFLLTIGFLENDLTVGLDRVPWWSANPWIIFWSVAVPTLSAAVFAVYIARWLIKWYETEMRKQGR
jgi:hypothetical protein